MTQALRIAAWITLTGGLVVTIGAIVAWWTERQALLTVLREVAPSGRFREREELVRLKRRLSEKIRWDPVRLLNLGGIPAHRLYLEGTRWGHVVVEHRWEGRWRLFDAHGPARRGGRTDRRGGAGLLPKPCRGE